MKKHTIPKSVQCLQFLLFSLGGSKSVLEVLVCMFCANVRWKCGAYFLKTEPLSRGSLSPRSHLVSPFNLNLKPDCHPPACFSCYYVRIRASQNKGAADCLKPSQVRISTLGVHVFCQNNVSDSSVVQRFLLKTFVILRPCMFHWFHFALLGILAML